MESLQIILRKRITLRKIKNYFLILLGQAGPDKQSPFKLNLEA